MISILILLLIILLGIFVGMKPMRSVAASTVNDNPADVPQSLKASVVVLALHSDLELTEYLSTLYTQEYADYEVIVVCDCNAETARMLTEQFASYPYLHITFLPPGSRRLSRRKLALTIGIKAASGDVVITTSTLVRPQSSRWLSAMMAPFNFRASLGSLDTIGAAMGVIAPNAEDFPKGKRSAVVYERNMAAIQWIGAALDGSPIRCAGFNMAFRRELFFELKGYSSSILLMDGDDDIFLRELSQYGECLPVLSPEAALITDYGENSMRILNEYREQYLFTRRYLPKCPFLRRAFSSWCSWLALPAAILPVTAGVYGILSLVHPISGTTPAHNTPFEEALYKAAISPWGTFPGDIGTLPWTMIACMAMAILLLAGFGIWKSALYNKAARKVNPFYPGYNMLYTIWRSLWQPLSNLLFKLTRKGDSSSHYTYRQG